MESKIEHQNKVKKLARLIQEVNIKYGGVNDEWLAGYIDDVSLKWKLDLDKAINCFEELLK